MHYEHKSIKNGQTQRNMWAGFFMLEKMLKDVWRKKYVGHFSLISAG